MECSLTDLALLNSSAILVTRSAEEGISYATSHLYRKHYKLESPVCNPSRPVASYHRTVQMEPDSSVCIMRGYGLNDRDSSPGRSKNLSSLSRRIGAGSGAHVVPHPMVTVAPSPGLKRPGRETDGSHPSGVEVKKDWWHTSMIPYVFVE